jgi:hypothetical protein
MKRRILYRGPDVFSEREKYWQRYQPATGMKSRANDIERQADERIVAEHEAGHAIAALSVGNAVAEIRLGGAGGAAGEFRARIEPREAPLSMEAEDAVYADLCDTLSSQDAAWALDRLTVTLAGLAYELGAGREHARDSCRSDIRQARLMAAAVTADELAANRLLDQALLGAARIVDEHREHIRALGDRLLRRRRLSGDDVRDFLAVRGFSLRSRADQRVDITGPAVMALRRLRGYADRDSRPSRPRCGTRFSVFGADGAELGRVELVDGQFEAWAGRRCIGRFGDLPAAARAI